MTKHAGRRSSVLARGMLAVLLVVSLGVSLGAIIAIVIPYFADEAEMGQIQASYTELAADESMSYPTVNWDALLQKNPDVVGWVYVPETNIDYPIVAASADSPEYYLKHDLGGNWSSAGTPYLDADCNRDFTSRNSIIFGHHLMNDTMFSAFANYVDEGFFNEHRTIYLLTPDNVLKLSVVAANVIDGNSEEKHVSFNSNDEYLGYWQSQLSESEVVASDAPQSPIRSFCFVTCSYQTSNARTLVYAVTES